MNSVILKELDRKFEGESLPTNVLEAASNKLPPRDAYVLQKRLEGHTYEEIGILINRSREVARQMTLDALNQISKAVNRKIKEEILILDKIRKRIGRDITKKELEYVKDILSPTHLQVFEARLQGILHKEIAKPLDCCEAVIRQTEKKILYLIERTLLSIEERIRMRPKSSLPKIAEKVIDMNLPAFTIANIPSIRTQNIFRNKYPDKTVRDLAQMTEEDLMYLHGLHKMQLEHIKVSLGLYGLRLGMNLLRE